LSDVEKSELETADGAWGTSAPCAQCGMWTLLPGSFGAKVGKEHLDDNGRCYDCVQANVRSALRMNRRDAALEGETRRQTQRDPVDAWHRIVFTAVCYAQQRPCPVRLAMAVRRVVDPLRLSSAWKLQRRIDAGKCEAPKGWEKPQGYPDSPPVFPADWMWDVFDLAVDTVRHGKVDESPLGRDLRALVQGMPRELRAEHRSHA
jgi:hypothetical protein